MHSRREKAAIAIQNRGRMRRAQRRTEAKRRRLKEERAATAIQKIHRGKRGRRKFDEDRAQQAVALELEMERIEDERKQVLKEATLEEAAIDTRSERQRKKNKLRKIRPRQLGASKDSARQTRLHRQISSRREGKA